MEHLDSTYIHCLKALQMPLFPRKHAQGDATDRHHLVRITAASYILLSASLIAFAPIGSRLVFAALLLSCAAVFHAAKLLPVGGSGMLRWINRALFLLASAVLAWNLISIWRY